MKSLYGHFLLSNTANRRIGLSCWVQTESLCWISWFKPLILTWPLETVIENLKHNSNLCFWQVEAKNPQFFWKPLMEKVEQNRHLFRLYTGLTSQSFSVVGPRGEALTSGFRLLLASTVVKLLKFKFRTKSFPMCCGADEKVCPLLNSHMSHHTNWRGKAKSHCSNTCWPPGGFLATEPAAVPGESGLRAQT